MATITLQLDIDNGGGDDHTGDAHVVSDGTPNSFDPTQSLGWVGRSAKDAPETNVFFRFDTSAVPLGSRIDAVNLRFTTGAIAVGTGDFRVGYISTDFVWPLSGFALAAHAGGGPAYALAYKFPNDGTAVRHATQDGSLTFEPGILILNNFQTANIPWTAVLFPANRRVLIGDGFGGEDYVEEAILTVYDGLRNAINLPIIALTMDSQAVGNADNRMNLRFREDSSDSRRPKFRIKYTENFPTFTSSPVTIGVQDEPYTYDADADPYALGDQTTGNFVDVTFGLEVAPTGMTINSGTGVISWTPTVGQLGLNNVTVRATNAGDLFVDQVFQVDVAPPPILGCPDGVARARSAVSGEVRHLSSTDGEAQASSAVTGQAQDGPAVSGRAIVRPAVSGSARRCSKE